MVEFALIVPLLFAMMFILVELGIIFSIYIGLTNSAREVARIGSVYQVAAAPPTNSAGCTTTLCTVDQARTQVMDETLRGTLNAIISVASLDQLNPTPNNRYRYEPATPSQNSYRYNDKLVVSLQYRHNLFFNLLPGRTITIRGESTMRLEPGGYK